MNLPEPKSTTFPSLMADIEKGITKIPQFQRDFVWGKEKSAALLDSIVKGYPIGTFILWKTKEELRSVRNIGGLNLPETPQGDYTEYVLDGQQRLTSLFAALKGLTIEREDTEIFTRLNVSGKPLSVFEIMVAKTFDSKANFDLSEKYDELQAKLETVDYGTISDSVVLQTLSIFLVKECRKKDILKLPRKKVIETWPVVANAIKYAVDHFRDAYRIPVSKLLPYPTLIVPFAYYFHKAGKKPTGDQKKLMENFFWRAALGGRYSQSVESRVAQDIRKIDAIIAGKSPKYEWAVDTSSEFIDRHGGFAVGRSYIKALLCILAYHQPKSFTDGSLVRISNDWLQRANSKNYHHFFPKAYLKKNTEEEEYFINHIANITFVDDWLNKSGIFEDDYDVFYKKRCQALSRELKKRIIEQEIDTKEPAVAAQDTVEDDSE